MSPLQKRRRFIFAFALFLLLALGTARVRAAGQRFRPALVGNGPSSLVNLIDGQRLIDKGQRDGVVMFDVGVAGNVGGSVTWLWCHAGPRSQLLKDEVEKKLRKASFVPAMIGRKRVRVLLHGAALFFVRQGRPYLQVFANQDEAELAKKSDYIQPQLVVGSDDWDGVQDMLKVVRMHARAGHAILSMTVDAEGKTRRLRLVREEPTGLNIGAAALKAYRTAKFIPGFRNGRPVACTFEENWAVRGYRYRRW